MRQYSATYEQNLQPSNKSKFSTTNETSQLPKQPNTNTLDDQPGDQSHPLLNHFALLNVQGLKPLTVQSSVSFVKDILYEQNLLFAVLTETCLNPHNDAEINIKLYYFSIR